jgi:hypothetical protein
VDASGLTWLQWIGVVLTPIAWATHIAIALAMQGLIALTLRRVRHAWWIGAAFATGYAYSREKTEFEFHLKAVDHSASVSPYWYRGFIPLEWSLSSQMQFYAPGAAVLLVAWAMTRRR